MATRVGFIGLGNIGKPMALNVARAGFDLMVYDLREEPLKELAALGATIARSAKEVGAHGEIIELVVVDDAQVKRRRWGKAGYSTEPGQALSLPFTALCIPRRCAKSPSWPGGKG